MLQDAKAKMQPLEILREIKSLGLACLHDLSCCVGPSVAFPKKKASRSPAKTPPTRRIRSKRIPKLLESFVHESSPIALCIYFANIHIVSFKLIIRRRVARPNPSLVSNCKRERNPTDGMRVQTFSRIQEDPTEDAWTSSFRTNVLILSLFLSNEELAATRTCYETRALRVPSFDRRVDLVRFAKDERVVRTKDVIKTWKKKKKSFETFATWSCLPC